MKTTEIKKKLFDYGEAVGYAICEQLEMEGYTKDELKRNGYRGGYLESESLPDAIFDGYEYSEKEEEILWQNTDEMYQGVNAAIRCWWGFKSVSSGSKCYDLTIECN